MAIDDEIKIRVLNRWLVLIERVLNDAGHGQHDVRIGVVRGGSEFEVVDRNDRQFRSQFYSPNRP